MLILSSALSNVLTYVDRLLLFPLLGGTMVSVYYASTLFGKAISLGITPINGVVLSYFSRLKRLKVNTFKTMLVASGILGVLGFFACMLVSRPILTLLYPQWMDQAMHYIGITTATAMVAMVISVIQPLF